MGRGVKWTVMGVLATVVRDVSQFETRDVSQCETLTVVVCLGTAASQCVCACACACVRVDVRMCKGLVYIHVHLSHHPLPPSPFHSPSPPLLSPTTGMNWRGYSWKTSSSTSMSPPAPTPSSTSTCVPWQRRMGYCFLRNTFPLPETGPQRLRCAHVLPVHGWYTSVCNGRRSVGSLEHAHLLLETLVQGRYVECVLVVHPVYCLQGLVVKCARMCLLYVCVCMCVIVVCL